VESIPASGMNIKHRRDKQIFKKKAIRAQTPTPMASNAFVDRELKPGNCREGKKKSKQVAIQLP
jgi:hypothetical protein